MANSTASIVIKPTAAFNRGDTFIFGSWICTADDTGSFQRYLTMTPDPDTGLVTLPEVVTSRLIKKFGDLSLENNSSTVRVSYFSDSRMASTFSLHMVRSRECRSLIALSWSSYGSMATLALRLFTITVNL
jgi:hypothetical protein